MNGLKELQNSWRIFARTSEYPYATRTFNLCADALQPHIEQQAKDMELIKRLLNSLQGYPSSEEGFHWLIQEARKRLEEV